MKASKKFCPGCNAGSIAHGKGGKNFKHTCGLGGVSYVDTTKMSKANQKKHLK